MVDVLVAMKGAFAVECPGLSLAVVDNLGTVTGTETGGNCGSMKILPQLSRNRTRNLHKCARELFIQVFDSWKDYSKSPICSSPPKPRTTCQIYTAYLLAHGQKMRSATTVRTILPCSGINSESWPKAGRATGKNYPTCSGYYYCRTKAYTSSSDACEWENLESIFMPDAHIYTTWTGKTHYADFLEMSKKGMDRGAFIHHRIHGSTTDINTDATRAVTKMKATISQRFVLKSADGKDCEVDAESDCRFCFFFMRNKTNEWKARWVRH
jgi:hypothetical protein